MKTRQQRIKQRAQKRERREHKEQSHFTDPMTGKQARKISKAEANMAYGEADRAIKGQIRSSAQQQKRVGSWYDTFANEIAASRGEVQGAYDKANAGIAGTIQTAAADDAARTAAVDANAANFAALTGGPADTGGARTAAAAQGQRNLYGATLAAPVAAQGANAYAYLTNEKNTARGEGIYQKIQERKRRQSLQQDRKALLKEKGQYRISKLNEMRDTEKDRALERWKVNKAFPLEKQAAATDAADTAFDNQIAARNAATAEKNANSTAYNAHHEDGEGKGPTQSERREQKQNWNDAKAAARTLFESRKWPSWEKLTQAVMNQSEVSPAMARAAVKKLRERVERDAKPGEIADKATPSPLG